MSIPPIICHVGGSIGSLMYISFDIRIDIAVSIIFFSEKGTKWLSLAKANWLKCSSVWDTLYVVCDKSAELFPLVLLPFRLFSLQKWLPSLQAMHCFLYSILSASLSCLSVICWSFRVFRLNRPLAWYTQLPVAHAPGMPGTFPGHRMLAIPTCITTRAWRTCREACRDR